MSSSSRSPSPQSGDDTHVEITSRARTRSRSPPRQEVNVAMPATQALFRDYILRPPGRGRTTSSNSLNNSNGNNRNDILAPPPLRHQLSANKISELLSGKKSPGGRYGVRDFDGLWSDSDGESDFDNDARDAGRAGSPERPTVLRVDPLSPQDVTVHMSLPISDDLEGLLEDFSRLRRLGRFSDALVLFDREQLDHFLDNRYVLLQYAQCLFEAGWVGDLARLAEQQATKPAKDVLGISWSLLKWLAEVDIPPPPEQRNILEAGMVLLRGKWPALDSTEMNILCAIVSQSPAFVGCFSPDDWGHLYEHLVDEGMAWEFRDLVQSIPLEHWVPLSHNGSSNSSGGGGRGFGESVPEQLFGRWHGEDGDDLGLLDDSTLFALFDVSTTLCLLAMKEADKEAKAERWLSTARRQASELAARDEGYIMSRPYLRWAVAGVLKADYRSWGCRGQYTFNGTLRQGHFAVSAKLFPFFTPVIYIPSADEAPEWQPLRRRPADEAAAVETIQAVLQAAESTGDQRVRAGCLYELMQQQQQRRGAEDADGAMRALHELWAAAGDQPTQRLAHLFRYMTARGPDAREQLRREILVDGRFPASSSLQYAQYRILRALSPRAWDKQYYEAQAEQVRQYQQHWNVMVEELVGAHRPTLRAGGGGSDGRPPSRVVRTSLVSRSVLSEPLARPGELAGYIEYGPSSVSGSRRQSTERSAEPGAYTPRRRRSKQSQAAPQAEPSSEFFDDTNTSLPVAASESAELPPIPERTEPADESRPEPASDEGDKQAIQLEN